MQRITYNIYMLDCMKSRWFDFIKIEAKPGEIAIGNELSIHVPANENSPSGIIFMKVQRVRLDLVHDRWGNIVTYAGEAWAKRADIEGNSIVSTQEGMADAAKRIQAIAQR